MAAISEVQEAAATDLGTLLDAGDFAIVTLVAGETRLAAHRAVLAATSPVFAHDLQETTSGQVSIPDVEGPVLRQLLAYCYTLKAPQRPCMAPQLLAASKKYGLTALRALCEKQMVAQLAVENAAETAVLAVRHSCPDLTEATDAFIKANLQVMATQGWADAMRTQPEDLIRVSQLVVGPPSETRTLSANGEGRRLIEAAKQGAVGELRALLAAGADVGARDEEDDYLCTALHWAARKGHVEAASCLLAAGADVNARDRWQQTPLHEAAAWGRAAMARLLLQSGADVNARNQWGSTPLHYAAQNGDADMAAALLQAGADRSARDDDGRTAQGLARQYNKQQLVDMLE